tara:strand:+ start:26688 stop:27089 length:402 start_codon:yes stop_codon:yes gene_type:complete
MNKHILLASFISPERIEWFIDYMDTKFYITKDKIFAFENLDDTSKIILTFKFVVSETNKINFKNLFPNTILIHKKGNCIYTINALNKLIEEISDTEDGNIDYKSVKINWEDYQGKIMLTNGNKLNISSIKRIF